VVFIDDFLGDWGLNGLESFGVDRVFMFGSGFGLLGIHLGLLGAGSGSGRHFTKAEFL